MKIQFTILANTLTYFEYNVHERNYYRTHAKVTPSLCERDWTAFEITGESTQMLIVIAKKVF